VDILFEQPHTRDTPRLTDHLRGSLYLRADEPAEDA
jgi:hypothetical protein